MPAPLLIADTPWLLYRSFFALPRSIADGEGRPVNALLGTVNAILAVIERPGVQAPRAVACCTGSEDAAYRVALYPPYHAHREPMPKDLAQQWQRAPELLESLGWHVCDAGELEADDAMFSLARAEADAAGQSLLLSGDRDMYAAVDDRVSVIELGKKGAIGEIGPDEVRRRYGVEPTQVADFIALRGDPSDGLPGAPGIGAKTAAELLGEHGSLEALLAAVEDPAATVRGAIKPRVAAILRENAQLLRTFRGVATLQTIDLARPTDAPTDFARGAQKAADMGMRRLAERLARLAAKA